MITTTKNRKTRYNIQPSHLHR